ncbi:hypothetical protein ACBQ16_14205 [Halopseudomonas bauzanensis]|uniref:hypothetical protein n=1 Tax=Halopseudomonas bauzanensis TaxID=653930 RepID=UPI00352450F1
MTAEITHPAPGLQAGGELTKQSWTDFVQRLRHDCIGKGVERHYTADAIFIVQARRIVFGIDRDYTDNLAVICDDQSWVSIESYWADLDQESRVALDLVAMEDADCGFLEVEESDQWEILAEQEDHIVTGWDERWEYLNAHFTKDAAEAFIKRKAHDYREGLRVYVDAQTYCWEFNTIKEAIMSGRLVLAEEKSNG